MKGVRKLNAKQINGNGGKRSGSYKMEAAYSSETSESVSNAIWLYKTRRLCSEIIVVVKTTKFVLNALGYGTAYTIL
jgi:hypothetical protein